MSDDKSKPTFFTSTDAARRLGVSNTTVRRLERAGILPTSARTEGGNRLFTLSEVERVRRERAANPPRPGNPAWRKK